MTDNATPIETLFERAEEYSKTTLKLFTLNAIDKSADVASSLVSRLAVVMTVALSIIIFTIGLSLWIGKQLGETFYGFFIMGGFYVLLSLLLHFLRHQWIKYPVRNTMIRQMMKTKKHENN